MFPHFTTIPNKSSLAIIWSPPLNNLDTVVIAAMTDEKEIQVESPSNLS